MAKFCARCGHLLEFHEILGKSFCPTCDQEQIDELIKWREQAHARKYASKPESNKTDESNTPANKPE